MKICRDKNHTGNKSIHNNNLNSVLIFLYFYVIDNKSYSLFIGKKKKKKVSYNNTVSQKQNILIYTDFFVIDRHKRINAK